MPLRWVMRNERNKSKQERSDMKIILYALALLLLSGCFVVIKDGDKVKVFGESKEIALDTLQKVENTKSEDKVELKRFGQPTVAPVAASEPEKPPKYK